jgi:cell division protease FtsH
MNPTTKSILMWVLILAAVVGTWNFLERTKSTPTISYTDFLNAVDRGDVTAVRIVGSTVKGRSRSNPVFEVTIPAGQAAVYEKLISKKVQVTVDSTDPQSGLTLFASWIFSIFAAFGLGWLCARYSRRQLPTSTMAV